MSKQNKTQPINREWLNKQKPEGVKPENFTRINNDTNGNPRYVCHFGWLIQDVKESTTFDVSARYAEALTRAKKIGGRKFHNKQFGGGIAFQSYNVYQLCDAVNKVCGIETNYQKTLKY